MTIKEKWVRYNKYVHKKYFRAYHAMNFLYLFYGIAIVLTAVLQMFLNLKQPFPFYYGTFIIGFLAFKLYFQKRLKNKCNNKLTTYFEKLNKEIQYISGGLYYMELKKGELENGKEKEKAPSEE